MNMRAFWTFVLAVLLTANLHAVENKVLELDGNGSYVELPVDIFTNLTQATVEVWAKWDGFRSFTRVFEFGAPWNSMSIFNQERYPDVRFNLYSRYAKDDRSLLYHIRVNGILRSNEWIHLAAVSGPGGMKLYANGNLVGEHTNTASFADIHVTQTNFFGRGLSRNPGDQDFRGQMDEIRVWDHRRTEAQIRENMRKRMTGKEEGLAGLWNFDNGTANDSSPNAFPGKLMGQATIVPAGSEADTVLLGTEPQKPASVVATAPIAAAPPPAPQAWRDPVAWWIAGALTALVGLLTWLMLMLRRSGLVAGKALPTVPARAQLPASAGDPGPTSAAADPQLKERALAELAEFAKESLVQGLYSQRKALLETQQAAQKQLAELEARLAVLHVPDRILAYEKRIAELEKELETRTGEVRELTSATLLLLRRKLEEEKQRDRESDRFN